MKKHHYKPKAVQAITDPSARRGPFERVARKLLDAHAARRASVDDHRSQQVAEHDAALAAERAKRKPVFVEKVDGRVVPGRKHGW